MRNLAPVIFVLIITLAFITAINAQERVYNPDLPMPLVFQWKITTDEVHSSWNNEAFSVMRDQNGLVVYYGTYYSLSQALESLPTLPEGVDESQVSLIPFFNQRSISAEDAFVLMGDRTIQDVYGMEEEQAVSFSVYFATYDKPMMKQAVKMIDRPLSFMINPNYTFSYSAGAFEHLEEAEEYADYLQSKGFEFAEVNKYLNGQKVAMVAMQEILAYVAWSGME